MAPNPRQLAQAKRIVPVRRSENHTPRPKKERTLSMLKRKKRKKRKKRMKITGNTSKQKRAKRSHGQNEVIQVQDLVFTLIQLTKTRLQGGRRKQSQSRAATLN
jgi:hypothetical protein